MSSVNTASNCHHWRNSERSAK